MHRHSFSIVSRPIISAPYILKVAVQAVMQRIAACVCEVIAGEWLKQSLARIEDNNYTLTESQSEIELQLLTPP